LFPLLVFLFIARKSISNYDKRNNHRIGNEFIEHFSVQDEISIFKKITSKIQPLV